MSGAAPGGPYRHTQRARLLVALLVSGVLAVTVVTVAPGRGGAAAPWSAAQWTAAAVAAVALLAAAAVFSSLTVAVDDEMLRWHFAFGALARTVPRADVAGAELTATTLLDGIGIHRGPRGWVYNVALGPAIRVVRRDGSAFLLGTDDPGGLVAALAPAGDVRRPGASRPAVPPRR